MVLKCCHMTFYSESKEKMSSNMFFLCLLVVFYNSVTVVCERILPEAVSIHFVLFIFLHYLPAFRNLFLSKGFVCTLIFISPSCYDCYVSSCRIYRCSLVYQEPIGCIYLHRICSIFFLTFILKRI